MNIHVLYEYEISIILVEICEHTRAEQTSLTMEPEPRSAGPVPAVLAHNGGKERVNL